MSALALAFSALMFAATPFPADDARGAMTVCFRYSSFSLAEGEVVEDVQMGIHGLLLVIRGSRGRYEVRENEIFARPHRLGRRVSRTGTASVYRSLESSVSYAIMGRPEFSPDRDVMILMLTGEALEGDRSDARIYSRVTVGDPALIHCDRRYLNGWDVLLGQNG